MSIGSLLLLIRCCKLMRKNVASFKELQELINYLTLFIIYVTGCKYGTIAEKLWQKSLTVATLVSQTNNVTCSGLHFVEYSGTKKVRNRSSSSSSHPNSLAAEFHSGYSGRGQKHKSKLRQAGLGRLG